MDINQDKKLVDLLEKLMDKMSPEQIHELKVAIVDPTRNSLSNEPKLITEREFVETCEKTVVPIIKDATAKFGEMAKESEGRITSKDITNFLISVTAQFSAAIETKLFLEKDEGGLEG